MGRIATLAAHRTQASTCAFRWDVYGWQGGDYHRFWIKSEGSQATGDDNDNEADVQLLYGKLIFPFVDLLSPASGAEAIGPRGALPSLACRH